MAKITRKQLKEDKLLSTTAKLSVFFTEHWKQIAGAIAAVIVVIAVILLYSGYVTSRNEKASRSFNEAKVLFDGAKSALDTEGKSEAVTEKFEDAKTKFQKVSQKGGHGDTTSKALFYSAKCSYQLGRYVEAVEAFQKFVKKHPRSILAPHVQKAIGHCYEQLGGDENLKKAIQQYDRVAKSPETYATLEACLDKGRCYEKLGQWEQAVAEYESITDKFKQNVEAAIQTKSKTLAQTAKDVISKYEIALGGGLASDDFAKFVDKAKAFEGKKQWFEALKAYDEAIASQKRLWSEKSVGEYSREIQNATNALSEYEDSSAGIITTIIAGKRLEEKDDWDGASRYYSRAVDFDFQPDSGLFEKAQFRIYWINSMERQ